MTVLPAASAAVVADEKARDYLLNEAHENDGGKAALFAAFGFPRERWTLLQQALGRHPADNEVRMTRERSPAPSSSCPATFERPMAGIPA